MTKKLRIAVWHNLPSGGAKRALWHYLSGLIKRGHHVESWCPPTAAQNYLPLKELCPEHIVPLRTIARVKAPKLFRWLANGIQIRREIQAMREHSRACAEQIHAQDFDVVFVNACGHFAMPPIGRYLTLPTAICLGEPRRQFYEVLPNSIWPAPAPRGESEAVCGWFRLLIDTLKLQDRRIQVREEFDNAHHYDRILTFSAFGREGIMRAYGLDSSVCLLGIDPELFRPTGEPVENYVMGLGAVQYHKGVDRAIEALGLIPAARRPKLKWVGNAADTDYVAKNRERAKQLGVDFEPLVMVRDAELVSLLSRAAALLYTSRLEPFGLAPLEANACGTPVIAIAEGGVRETIAHGENGILVPDARPQSIATALQQFLDQPAEAAELRAKSRNVVLSRWGLESSITRLEQELWAITKAVPRRSPTSQNVTTLPPQPPLVSICVPTYNGAAYLVECLECICAQTLKDFEVIIVDDASTDRSHEIALDYARRDPRFQAHRNPHRLGLVGNWNRCLELSRGEWLKLLFQDDLLEARCLERLVAACQQRQQRFGFCHRQIIFDAQAPAATRDFFAGHQQLLTELYGTQDSYVAATEFARMTVRRLDRNLIGEPTVTLFHRSLIHEFGMFVPDMVQTCDSEYWIRLATNIGVVHVAERLATFRVHDKSTTSQNLAKHEYAIRRLDPLVMQYLFLHEKHFATLRQELYRTSGRLINWWRLIWAAQDAQKHAVAPLENPAVLKQWHEVVQAYPKLKWFVLAGKFLNIIRSGLAVTGLDRRLKKSRPDI